MNLRPPAVPLVTADPYFSIWSPADQLNDCDTCHWTGSPHRLEGFLTVDGETLCFMGSGEPKMKQAAMDVTALSTKYVFEHQGLMLSVRFTSPLLLDDLALYARPLTYLSFSVFSKDNEPRPCQLQLILSDELVLNYKAESSVSYENGCVDGAHFARIHNTWQRVLNGSGDDLRINWGYLYAAAADPAVSFRPRAYLSRSGNQANDIIVESTLDTHHMETVIALAYDDIRGIEYFGDQLEGAWKREFPDMPSLLVQAFLDYPQVMQKCIHFGADLQKEATRSCSKEYAQLLALSYRQVCAAHKLCYTSDGELLYLSKECFSNGCAATVDISYPSLPLFLLYAPQLVAGMLRPIFKYAASPDWPHPYAPHDVGRYPLLNGQVYSGGTNPEQQMPLEECGNMILMTAAYTFATGDRSLMEEYWTLLERWEGYLLDYGMFPHQQLCTDDFAGALGNNCNLSIKALIGVAAFSRMAEWMGKEQKAKRHLEEAHARAEHWLSMAQNKEGAYALSFDQPDPFSLKYNAIWDKLLHLNLFPEEFYEKELSSYLGIRMNRFGVPLDNRATFTKSDWIIWCAAFSTKKEERQQMVLPLWRCYHQLEDRFPLPDWLETVAPRMARKEKFVARSVQGGLFMLLLRDRDIFS